MSTKGSLRLGARFAALGFVACAVCGGCEQPSRDRMAPGPGGGARSPHTERDEAAVPEGAIAFVVGGRETARFTFEQARAVTPLVEVTTRDPYYGATKRFRALRLAPLLERAFGEPESTLRGRDFLLRALDGYEVPIAGARLLEPGAYLAVDDVDVPGMAPIGPRQVSPRPAYLVWEGTTRTDLTTHPRPYQLATIAIARFEDTFPHVVPNDAPPDGPARRGFETFRARCIRCHAVNREGGRVGPELNVPRNVTEYRDDATLRAFIRAPRDFRYSAMPSHRDLDDAALDDLLAYLRHMAAHKHDPGGEPEAE